MDSIRVSLSHRHTPNRIEPASDQWSNSRAVKFKYIDRRVPGSIPETTDFLTNSSVQDTNAHVLLFTKQYKLVPAGGELLFAFNDSQNEAKHNNCTHIH